MTPARAFVAARDELLRAARSRDAAAAAAFRWPAIPWFNWALDYFDVIARDNHDPALIVVNDEARSQMLSFSQLSRRSSQVANWLRALGVEPGDRILLMTGNVPALWELLLAAIKLRAVVVPSATLLSQDELHDRMRRGAVKAVVTHGSHAAFFESYGADVLRIAIDGDPGRPWAAYADSASAAAEFTADAATACDDPLFLYFTSGTTSKPKLVEHSHASYPIGHLSTMYWLGCRPGDVHLNLSSPGWAKHAWSSCFGPWNAQASIVAYQYDRFNAAALLKVLERERVTTFCAPPTVWRALVQCDLRAVRVAVREALSAGEPLNAEIIATVERAWGLTIRDGFGQSETTALIGNPPGARVKPGSMGKPLPGYGVCLRDAEGRLVEEGEICIDLAVRPTGLMRGYRDHPQLQLQWQREGCYRTGDVAVRDADGYYFYVGRLDDVFKSSDYRISPFELESVLIEHPAVAEAAVIPKPDARRLTIPKAVVVLAAGYPADQRTAASILDHVRTRVAAFKRIRCIEFAPLPKTISGKIRRSELKRLEIERASQQVAVPLEFTDGTPQ